MAYTVCSLQQRLKNNYKQSFGDLLVVTMLYVSGYYVYNIGGKSYWAGQAVAHPLFGHRGPQPSLSCPLLRLNASTKNNHWLM